MAIRRNRSLRPAPVAGRHLDDGHRLTRYADRVAVHCHRCDAPGWVLADWRPYHWTARFRCGSCGAALDSAAGDWVGPVHYGGRRPCGYCGHQWVCACVAGKPGQPAPTVVSGLCPHCGRSSEVSVSGQRVREGEANDPHFGLPLLLVEPTRAGVLWAYNAAHLQALHEYVVSPLRERAGVSNGSMFSRLPGWMKLGRNRAMMRKAIERMLVKARHDQRS
ncbi:hypothetical protein PDM29_06000 [Stenotrophomonas oahuensis]|uniref:GATA-type domain-containing protein n=1 Tax=Stenotrophomonas oahuensis TaxID=3003271 RepID=A0ABY9YSC2_9GAMM|nr:hypothetical protein PDM29_06000 [Stenotrophomonas sp. A5586]